MNILLTGTTGYIGKRLLPVLVKQGHKIYCCVRDKKRFKEIDYFKDNIELIEIDFLKPQNFPDIKSLPDIDVAYYLIHSMSTSLNDFAELEKESAENFLKFVKQLNVKQLVYLSGISNEKKLSKHLSSRKNVENILSESSIPTTILRAGIIVGSGSASFEIIRDLVEKLPVMITPKWLNTKCQPISIGDVINYLTGIVGNQKFYNKVYDVGGPEVLTYKEMLNQFAEIRGLKRIIITLPVMTPRLSSYWLYFVTAVSYKLAVNLVNSMKVNVVCGTNNLEKEFSINPITYKEAIRRAFKRVEQNQVVSSWKDSNISSEWNQELNDLIEVPVNGCFISETKFTVKSENVIEKLWKIGGKTGWYYADFLWSFRGMVDKLFGGVGLRRGRTNKDDIFTGDSLDFWRVIIADKDKPRLLLFAEMKLPGEAWLEFKIEENGKDQILVQTATFRPKGLLGRLYWYLLLPAHNLIFKGMCRRIAE